MAYIRRLIAGNELQGGPGRFGGKQNKRFGRGCGGDQACQNEETEVNRGREPTQRITVAESPCLLNLCGRKNEDKKLTKLFVPQFVVVLIFWLNLCVVYNVFYSLVNYVFSNVTVFPGLGCIT